MNMPSKVIERKEENSDENIFFLCQKQGIKVHLILYKFFVIFENFRDFVKNDVILGDVILDHDCI